MFATFQIVQTIYVYAQKVMQMKQIIAIGESR